MSADSLSDESIWGLPGARMAEPLVEAEAFCATSILTLLHTVAAAHSGEVALVSQTASLRYSELIRLAEKAAAAVSRLVPPGHPIACLLPRSTEGVAVLLGTLMSGRLCMVLDPSHPAQRQIALLEDAKPAALILAEPLPFPYPAPVLMLDDVVAEPDHDWHPDYQWDPDAPCAVYFTSGSSGRPKGIVLSARSILYRALDSVKTLGLTRQDRVFAPSIPFASSGLSFVFGALSCGARLVLSDVAGEGASAVLRLVEREMVTCAMIQPPILRLLSLSERSKAAFRMVRTLRTGAGSLARADLTNWRMQLPSECIVWHSYASTEALSVASWAVPFEDTGPEATVAAGLLNPNHDYTLLGEDQRPVPFGHPGELVLRSRYVALGEWQGGQLVVGRMPPVLDRPGWRYFRTGDLLRLQPDGLIRVVGRADRQVKINGVRVEPAEIEAILRAEPAVADAVVVAVAGVEGTVLHGFVTTSDGDQPDLIRALRRRLATSLPSALRPARLTVLDKLPTLPSGKIDIMSLSRQP